jgi:hypothetical protein
MKIKFPALLLLLVSSLTLSGQGFTSPAEGKAVVYFVRLNGLGFAVNFEYFMGDKYIGDFAGRGYLRHECDPGEHLFWASSGNQEFVPAKLKADATYVILVDVELGDVARVALVPITERHDIFDRVKKYIERKTPEVNTKAEIKQKNGTRRDFIAGQIKRYEEDKATRDFKNLSENMNISEGALK